MTTFRKLMQEDDNGVSMLSSSDAIDTKIRDASPFAALSSKKLDIDKEALKAKSIDDELTDDEAEYVQLIQSAARSLSEGQEFYNSVLDYIKQGRSYAEDALNEYKNALLGFLDIQVTYGVFTDPDA